MTTYNFGKIKDALARTSLYDLAETVVDLKKRVSLLERKSNVSIPVVGPDGTQVRELSPRILEYQPRILEYQKVYEERDLTDVVRWLEEMLECKFQIIRTPDQEGGYDITD